LGKKTFIESLASSSIVLMPRSLWRVRLEINGGALSHKFKNIIIHLSSRAWMG